MSEVNLLHALAAWYEGHHPMVQSVGGEMTFGRTDDDRNKHSAWIELELNGRLGELILWESGEAEYVLGGEDEIGVNEHHELASGDQLDALLERLLTAIIR